MYNKAFCLCTNKQADITHVEQTFDTVCTRQGITLDAWKCLFTAHKHLHVLIIQISLECHGSEGLFVITVFMIWKEIWK